ncbi:ATP-binding cassette domain-containing protein [Luteolibacter arcticus]|uniref:ATP-binding cassette domain-containing protein n=1 Tax=Luteolibacter arcticus TaxID=1581411 RepID=A0ABT3GFW4_9BACT|nr:ATP-binding cassette domain-containing protein [Luteolibacter arcticus]MCW1922512.1 ATP-binding cassette domain-containing protein [Luteolibacter arcticus]
MEARLIAVDPQGGHAEVVLPKEPVSVGGRPEDGVFLRIGVAASILRLRFDPSLSTWVVDVLEAPVPVRLNDEPLAERASAPLVNGDQLAFLGFQVGIRLISAEPVFNGRAASILPLPKSGALVFGRGEAPAGEAAGFVGLDADDQTISSKHFIIERQQGGHIIRDVSRFGTTLNGVSFSTAELVYGDRIKIGHYTFEFDGKALRWLDHPDAGMIEAERLTREAGGRKILNEVTLRVRPGEFVGILGGSGQGKSTLLNALCGIVPASSGAVRVSRQLLEDRSSIRDLGVGYVPQDDIVHRELTVNDALLLSGRLRLNLPVAQIRARIDRIIGQLGLEEHRAKRVYMLSGGQRKRVSIGIELLSNPSVLFLDEPSSGLDPATEENLMVLLQKLALSGITVVCTTHVLQKAYLFDRLLFIQDGRLVFSGDSDEARTHFLGGGQAGSQLEAPLEKIYSILADRSIPAEAREQAYLASPFAPPPAMAAAPPAAATRRGRGKGVRDDRRVPAPRALATLLKRQWKIVVADPLNLAFLLAQAVVIAILIAWASDDIGMRMFLMVVASMWFGCSNAAQQIVGEIMIFRRERVCGLGLATYYGSKLLFLGALTALQTLLLFGCAHLMARHWHPEEFNRPEFERQLNERYTAVAGQEEPVMAAADDDFIAKGDEDFGLVEEQSAQSSTTPAAPAPPPPPSPPKPGTVERLASIGDWFHLGGNLTESGPRDLLLENGERARDPAGKLLSFAGLPIDRVLTVTLLLRAGGLLSAGLIGVILGLTVSTLVRSATQAVMWVPLLLIPQILFGGFVIPYPEMSGSARAFSRGVPSFACQRLIDVSHVYGRAMPFLSNRTKTPVFLTTDGSKETIEWERAGKPLSQDYDRISPFNRSWQNLLVVPDDRGRHKQESVRVTGTFTTIPRDSVKSRQDVRYLKGTVFRNLQPAWAALGCLGAWVAVCATVTLSGLVIKQTGG